MKKYLGILGKVAVLGIFALAVWLLYHKLRSYSLGEIKHSLHQIPLSQLLLSFGLMIINYMVLIGYDWLALKAIHKKLALARVSLVSFVGCVISYNFGALLGGSTVRYRLYSAWGFSTLDIVRLVLMLAVTFWVGAMGLAGAIFLFVPLDVPPELGITANHIRPLGGALMGLCLIYLLVCWRAKGRSIKLFGKEFALPTLHIALAQTFVAGLDLVVAASCLYALLPADSGVSFLEFLPSYLLAQVTVVLTHVPGGMGVLEVILMNLTHGIPSQNVFAAILAFRVIYYLLPLLIVAVLLGAYEIHLRRHEADVLKQEASRWLRAWLPTILSYAVFVAGAILCLDVVIPAGPRILHFLRPHIPLWIVEAAHMLTGLVGVLLLMLACGIESRKHSAWKMTLWAICLGILGTLLQGGDWPEALMLLILLFPLLAARRCFGRIAPIWRGSYPMSWATAGILVILCGLLLGVYFSGLPRNADMLADTLMHSSYFANTPRIWRTLTAETVMLIILIGLYLYIKWKEKKAGKKM